MSKEIIVRKEQYEKMVELLNEEFQHSTASINVFTGKTESIDFPVFSFNTRFGEFEGGIDELKLILEFFKSTFPHLSNSENFQALCEEVSKQ